MNCLPLVLCLMLLLDSVLSSLPAPVNVSINSTNFHHVLRWDPGPGTPPGTRYNIFRKENNKLKLLKNTEMTSVKLRLKKFREQYFLMVQASYNQSLSSEYYNFTFAPYAGTTIGPPKLSMAGCGNCIQINISLPEPDKSIGVYDMHDIFDPLYQVLWKRRDGKLEMPYSTEERSFTLHNLQRGTEYCVQVHPKTRVNKHTKTSTWECIYTSAVESGGVPAVLGTVTGLLIFAFFALMTFMLLLCYTGFICKLKENLPRDLMTALSRGYLLTPERMIPDQISISPDMKKQRKHSNPTMPQTATRNANSEEEEEEEEEEEDEGINVYINRAAELSSGQTSCRDSGDMSGNKTLAASGDSGSLTVEPEVSDTECEGTHDEDEAKTNGAEASVNPERHQTGVQGHATAAVVEEEEEEEVVDTCDSSCNVDLFSVTLAALAGCEEEEEEEQNKRDSFTDFLKLSYQEPQLPTDSQTDADDQTTVALMLLTQVDFTETGYEGKHADTLSGCLKACDEEEEEEEEEEFSGYMKHT